MCSSLPVTICHSCLRFHSNLSPSLSPCLSSPLSHLPPISLSLPPLILIGPQAHQTEGGDAANNGRCHAHSSIEMAMQLYNYMNYGCCGILSRLKGQYNSAEHHTTGAHCVQSV